MKKSEVKEVFFSEEGRRATTAHEKQKTQGIGKEEEKKTTEMVQNAKTLNRSEMERERENENIKKNGMKEVLSILILIHR